MEEVGGDQALDICKVLTEVDGCEQRGDVVEAVCTLCSAYAVLAGSDTEAAQQMESRAQSLLADVGSSSLEDLVKLEEPQRAAALLGMKSAQSLIRSGLLEAAEDACLVTIEQVPDFLPAQAVLAEVYAKVGSVEKAIEKYQYLIDLYRIRNCNRQAISVLEQVLRLDPTNEERRQKLISWSLEEGMIDCALREMESVAKKHLANGETALGLDTYSKMVDLAPSEAWIHTEYGKALESAGRWREATLEYVRSWELQPHLLDSCLRVVRSKARDDDWRGVEAALDELIDLAQSDTGVDFGRGHTEEGSSPAADVNRVAGGASAVVEGLRAILYELPGSKVAHGCLGVVLAHMGELSEAEAHLREVLDQETSCTEKEATAQGTTTERLLQGAQLEEMQLVARLHLGRALLAGGQAGRAGAVLSEGLKAIRAGFAEGKVALQKMKLYLKTLESAYRESENKLGLAEILADMKAITPDDIELRSELAALYFELGQDQSGLAELLDLSAEYRRNGNREAEIEVLQECRSRVPSDLQVRRYLCDVLLELGRCEDAGAELESLAELQRCRGELKDAASTLRRMIDVVGTGDRLRTLARREQIIALDPEDFYTREQLAETYLRTGQASKALEFAVESARASLAYGDREVAARSLQTVVRIDPWNAWALQELGEILFWDEERTGDKGHSQSLGVFRRLQRLSPNSELAVKRIEEIAGRIEG